MYKNNNELIKSFMSIMRCDQKTPPGQNILIQSRSPRPRVATHNGTGLVFHKTKTCNNDVMSCLI